MNRWIDDCFPQVIPFANCFIFLLKCVIVFCFFLFLDLCVCKCLINYLYLKYKLENLEWIQFVCWGVSKQRCETAAKYVHGSQFSNFPTLGYLLPSRSFDRSAVVLLVIQVYWKATLAACWHRSLAKLLGQVLLQHLTLTWKPESCIDLIV